MFERFTSLIRSGWGTRILIIAFFLLVIACVFVGFRDMLGYMLGYLATAVLYILVVRRWRSVRAFVILFVASGFGIIFLSFFYVEVLSRLALYFRGAAALEGLPLRAAELVITYAIIFAGVTGLVFGMAGALILGGAKLSLRRSAGSIAD